MKKILLFALCAIFYMSCATQGSKKTMASDSKASKEIKVDETDPATALESHLRRASGVQISGSGENLTVKIRGDQALSGHTPPLYVLNGRDVGNSYASTVSLLKGMTISSVRVLKSSEASIYGARGFGGVIVIKAK